MDSQRAFDKVNHYTLLKTLEHIMESEETQINGLLLISTTEFFFDKWN